MATEESGIAEVDDDANPEPSPTLPVVTDQLANPPTVMPAITPTSLPQAVGIRGLALPGGLEITQVYVPAGSFLMGSADDDRRGSFDEKPQHEVILDSFWLDQT
jgi:formylglycine-generating enzyme required for sulfatase activity